MPEPNPSRAVLVATILLTGSVCIVLLSLSLSNRKQRKTVPNYVPPMRVVNTCQDAVQTIVRDYEANLSLFSEFHASPETKHWDCFETWGTYYVTFDIDAIPGGEVKHYRARWEVEATGRTSMDNDEARLLFMRKSQ